jgi:hypothetical protein
MTKACFLQAQRLPKNGVSDVPAVLMPTAVCVVLDATVLNLIPTWDGVLLEDLG